MANEKSDGNEMLWNILGGIVTGDPFAYQKFKMQSENLRLENLVREKQARKFQQEEERGNQPASLSIPVQPTAPTPTQAPNLPAGPIAGAFGYTPTEEGGTRPPEGVGFTTQRQGGIEQIPLGRTVGSLGPGELGDIYQAYIKGMTPKEDAIQHVSTPIEDVEGKLSTVQTFKSGKSATVPTGLKAKEPGLKLQHVSQDKGDMTRSGTFNTETGEHKWGDWVKKGAAPSKESKPQKVGAQYDSWEKTIDRRYKQVGARYKLTDQEMQDLPGKDSQFIINLFSSKGLSPDAIKKFSAEVGELDEVRAAGLQDIENGEDPYKRLKTVGKGLGQKSKPQEEVAVGPESGPPDFTPKTKGYATFKGKQTNWYWDGKEWTWIEKKK